MNQTSKIILAVVITAILVGGGVYYWQTQNSVPADAPTTEEAEPTITDNEPAPVAEVDEELTIANNWQTYQSQSYGFNISYPQGWVYEEFNNTIYFGTPESKSGGYIWGVFIHQANELEKVIAQMGDQFEDRKESRSEVMVNKNITGTMVTVTTNKYTDWISKTVYFENSGQLFAIGNGAINDDRFETFYKSFEFAN
jgi:hypothetical protein